MQIIEISVEGLFGVFDHNIPLQNAARVTIIHGPNGLGKTMMLKMIAALIVGRTRIFEQVPFEQFRVLLDDGKTIIVRHQGDALQDDAKRHNKLDVSIFDSTGRKLQAPDEDILPDVPRQVLDALDQHIPGPYSRYKSGWKNPRSGTLYSIDDILELFPSAAKYLPTEYRMNNISNIFKGLKAFFVETTRLNAEKSMRPTPNRNGNIFQSDMDLDWIDDETESPQPYVLRVDQYSRDIVQRIKSALADYAKHSQESDRTFPERLVRFVRDENTADSEAIILTKMAELETKRKRLIALGFLDSESGLSDLTEDDVRRAPEALTIYVGDVQKKLSVFDDLSQRVGKLIDIINARFKYKTLTLHRDHGFRLIAKSGEPIQLEDLSSGEQHELVVLYELLFRAPRNGLVLVDEPEISLHVAWQSRFLVDLMDILELTDSYGIVATHSPVIIGTRWDLTKELNGPDDGDIEKVI